MRNWIMVHWWLKDGVARTRSVAMRASLEATPASSGVLFPTTPPKSGKVALGEDVVCSQTCNIVCVRVPTFL